MTRRRMHDAFACLLLVLCRISHILDDIHHPKAASQAGQMSINPTLHRPTSSAPYPSSCGHRPRLTTPHHARCLKSSARLSAWWCLRAPLSLGPWLYRTQSPPPSVSAELHGPPASQMNEDRPRVRLTGSAPKPNVA